MENRGLRPTIGSHVAANESLFVQIHLPFLLVAKTYQSPLEAANRALAARKLSMIDDFMYNFVILKLLAA